MKLFLIFFLIHQSLFAYINIHPTTFDKRIDFEGSYEEYTLVNTSNNPIMYRIYTEKDKNSNLNMESFMEYYPRSLVLKPGEMGKIQLSISSNSKIPEGEYSGILGIRELPVFNENNNKTSGVQILTDLKLTLMGYAGDISPKLIFKNLKITNKKNKNILNGLIKNSGKLRGKYEIYINEHFLGYLRILPGEELDFYKMDFSGEFKLEKNNKLKILNYTTKELIYEIKI